MSIPPIVVPLHSQPTAYRAHATQPTVPSAKRSQSATGFCRRGVCARSSHPNLSGPSSCSHACSSMSRLLLCALLLGAAQAFVVPAVRPGLHRHSPAAPAASSVLQPTAVPARVASAPQMGLFGLGWAELGVIGLLAIFIFGPEKLAPLAKDLGVPAFQTRATAGHAPQRPARCAWQANQRRASRR